MSIIERAAQRLEQLRKAGVEAPSIAVDQGSEPRPATPTPEPVATAERRAAARSSVHLADGAASMGDSPASAGTPPGEPAGKSKRPAESPRRSSSVEIDLASLAKAGFITPDAQRSQIADEFRVIKRPIIKNAQGGLGSAERSNCVMVTSALPSEGKSFVALNLALSIASEVDSTVLLVDADVANPNVLKTMKLPAAKGLLDLLTDGSLNVADVLLKTNVEKLSLLPAGSAHGQATEMLASTGMAELVDQMSSRYPDRILVFDSPPLLATTEARVLASHMGQIIMVVEADVTSQAAVAKALETIENCPVVLMVLNKAARTDVGGYYGYGFYGAPAA